MRVVSVADDKGGIEKSVGDLDGSLDGEDVSVGAIDGLEDGENVDGSVVVDTEGDLLGGCVECAVGATDGVLDGGAVVHTMS